MRARYFLFGCGGGVMLAVLAAVALVASLAKPGASVPPPSPGSAAGDIVALVSENYLSRIAADLGRAQDRSVRSVTADVHPAGQLDLNIVATVSLAGLQGDVQVKVSGTLTLSAGRPSFVLEKISVIGIAIPVSALPQSLRTTIESTRQDMTDGFNRQLDEAGFVVVALSSDESNLTVTLRAK